jgi:asparagine synthetase B (glutamine-hydrolysing)
MCGFGISNITYQINNNKCRRRGPDLTTEVEINGVWFVHNLLHITGELTPQPFVSDNIVCTYNGEIYNYKELGNYKSDGQCIIDQYKKHGKDFAKFLDGEYAICLIDFSKNQIYLTSDTFATKPMWYYFNENKFAISSYQTQINKYGPVKRISHNVTLVFDLETGKKIDSITNVVFNLNQYKNTYDDWIYAFENSIRKRTINTNANIFIGLSSGYDSGAIACELKKQNINFKAYSIITNEKINVVEKRIPLIDNIDIIDLSITEFNMIHSQIMKFERFKRGNVYDSYEDPGTIGLASICSRARKDNCCIYLSGQGADEVLCNYGGLGKWRSNKLIENEKLFPNDLNSVFPWRHFWNNKQVHYLKKEEYVAGHFGIEARYPFLDKALVQEFLWLTSSLKNKEYKACLDYYFKTNKFPYHKNGKKGFVPVIQYI